MFPPFLRRHLALICLLLLAAAAGTITPYFWSVANIGNIISQAAIPMLLAIGACFVIGSGQIDLSVGSVLALGGLTFGIALNGTSSVFMATISALGVGMLCGLVNGIIAARIPAIIVSLGTMASLRGIALAVTSSESVNLTAPPPLLDLGSISLLSFASLLVGVGALLIFRRTKFGLRILATGSNERAARNIGISVTLHRLAAFLASGALAALGGAFLTIRLGAARPTAGAGYELDAIAAAIIGGAALTGGRVSVSGALAATLLFSTIRNSFTLLGVAPALQQVLTGVVLLVVVFAQMSGARRRGPAHI